MIKYITEVVPYQHSKSPTIWYVIIRKTYNVDTDETFALGPYRTKEVAELVERAFVEPLQSAEDHTMLAEDLNDKT